ncbi:MAG TPA: Ig-like domain-containing protein [Candidatus Methylomirabilis sp.]|nr:Ig-like domain-containing protein [Candidatus Methylomirabilis sp.]
MKGLLLFSICGTTMFVGCASTVDYASLDLAKKNAAIFEMAKADISEQVASIYPTPGDNQVPIDTKIQVNFKATGLEIRPTADTVFVVRGQYQEIISGEVIFGTGMMTFVPSEKLKSGYTYEVTFKNVRYEDRTKLIGSRVLIFTTKEDSAATNTTAAADTATNPPATSANDSTK